MREPELVQQAVADSAHQIGVSESEINAYFGVIRRTLDSSDLAGQEKFLREYDRYFTNDSACSYWAGPDAGFGPALQESAFG
jgi:hypothetical protein